MSFSGSGAGRFQIRRIRNGSTAESLIVANGPLFQDFAEPTGQHTPNWDHEQEAGDIDDYVGTEDYAIDDEVEFMGGIYKALVAITGQTTVADPDPNAPTAGQTDDQWEYEGPIGAPLVLDPELLVNGVTVDTSTAFARAASPVNAQVTGIAWSYLSSTTGQYVAITTSLGFRLGTDNTTLSIIDNLDDTAKFPAGALSDNMLHIRCEISYNITGVLNASNTLQTLTSTSFITIRRTLLTESSMFARSYLTENGGVAGASSQIWNSGFTGDKQFQADLIIGAAIANDAADFDVTYQWYDSDGTITGATGRTLTRTRAQVATAETFYCIVTDVHTGISYTTNSIELRDFLDPVQFVEIGTATVDTGSNGRLLVVPYQNGAPMKGLTAANTIFDFTFDRQANATDTTGSAGTWLTTVASGGLVATGGTATTNRFLTNAGATRAGGSYQTSNTIARIGVEAASTASNEGVTIQVTDTELGAFGAFIEYDVTFTSISN